MKGTRFLAPLAAALLAGLVLAGCSGESPASSAASSPVSQESRTQESQPVSALGFDEYFSQNPLDKDYAEQSAYAVTTADMVKLEQKFGGLWQKEIENAYQKLLSVASPEEQSQLEQEQTQWSAGRQAAVDEIIEHAQQNGGTMTAVTGASEERIFYRERARELYEKLYAYDPAYSYAYSGEEQG